MFAPDLSKNQKARYYSLLEDIGVKELKAGQILDHPDTTSLEKRLVDHHIDRMVADEFGYHFKCMKIPSKPYIIYSWGDKNVLDLPLIGIVGPRKASSYAQGIMKDFFAVLSQYRVATISGGAPGIDTFCHELSLQYAIPTVVVLGGGLGHYLQYPHPLLQHVVDAGGLILSEFKLKQVPTAYTFPQRNRIIAGLAETLFVPAAGQKSGSLITVDFALQIHTTVYTVPASLHEAMSAGSNAYLAEGRMKAVVDFTAMLDTHFERKNDQGKKEILSLDLSSQQQAIISHLQEQGTLTRDQLAHRIGVDTSVLLADITILEMYTCIREDRPGCYVLA